MTMPPGEGVVFLLSHKKTMTHYPNDTDRSINEDVSYKIRKYRNDYNHNPLSVVSFMSPMTSTSGRLHCEFIRLLFLQRCGVLHRAVFEPQVKKRKPNLKSKRETTTFEPEVKKRKPTL